jgi:antibiotic biosynthesis monooxygenase (ABM) superfamily enzyme
MEMYMTEISVSRPVPSKFRLALLMLAAIYPFVTAILYILMPLTENWPLWARTAVLAPVMVFSIVYGIAPVIQRRFAWFILRRPEPALA